MGEQDEENINWGTKAWTHLSSVRQQSPLIQCITNFVSMDLMANTLLSAGASPAMIHCLQEIPDFTPHVRALCINVGTLTPDWVPAMKSAAELVIKLGKPWVLDPVSAGATSFRLKACHELVELKPTVIRGNGSEIIALSKASLGPTKVIALSALSIFGVAGELGMEIAKGPASLRMHMIDSLHGLDQDTVLSRVKITRLS